ncbi:MAG: ATP-binding protein [Acidobacteriota bacterium]
MTPEALRTLVDAGETLEVEFKGEDKKRLTDGDLVEAVVCLANRQGTDVGWLLVGVEDDGRLTGARPRHEAGITDPRRVQALIASRTRPSLSCRVELVRTGDVEVLAIEVPPARTPVATSDGSYYRRAIGHQGQPECLPMFFHEMQSLQADRGALDYSALTVADASWSDLDPLEFERFRRSIRETGRGDRSLLDLPDLELAKALGAVTGGATAETIRVLALLLFGREESLRRLLPTHETAFQILSGRKIEVNDFLRWPLVRTVEEFGTRLRARNREEELMVGMLRVGVPDYSPVAFREALANALVHRDYTRLGAAHVQWQVDRITISNPGGFPEGIGLANFLVAGPRPRNPLLADAFKRAGIVERTGRGIDTIFEEQLRNGRPAPSYGRSTPAEVAVELPGGTASLAFVRLLVEESQGGRLLSFLELLILDGMWRQRSLSTAEAALLSQRPEPEAHRSLERLVEDGLVEARGEKKGRVYHLSAATYRRLGEKAAYVRRRGFEPLQQEQMILQYAEKHRRIKRSEVMELCQVGPQQATRLLARLTRAGKLLAHGVKKGVWYERAPNI